MSQPDGPFTLDQLIALLEQVGIPYSRQGDERVLAEVCNRGISHELCLVVVPEGGFCGLAQHNLVVCSPELTPAGRIAELCRFALMLNGLFSFGGYVLGGRHATSLGFCGTIPTAGASISAAQLEQSVGLLVSGIDDTYLYLQQVLWGGLSADEALAQFHAFLDRRAGSADADEHGPADLVTPGDEQDEREIEAIDDAFLESLDPADPFSAAAAEAILSRRGVEQHEAGGESADS